MPRFLRGKPAFFKSLVEVVGAHDAGEFGDVVVGLAQAHALGMPVGATQALTAEAFRRVVRHQLPPGHDPAALLRVIHRPRGVERAARARERFSEVDLEPELLSEITRVFAALSEGGASVLVRASPVVVGDASTAVGELTSEVIVDDSDAAVAAVLAIWALPFREGVLRTLRAGRVKQVAMSAVFQPIDRAALRGTLSVGAAARVGDGARARVLRLCAAVDGTDVLFAARRGASPESRAGAYVAAEDARGLDAIADAMGATRLPAAVDFALGVSGPVVLGLRDGTRLEHLVGGGPSTNWGRFSFWDSAASVGAPLTRSISSELVETGLQEWLETLGLKGTRSTLLLSEFRGRRYLNLSQLTTIPHKRHEIAPASLLELLGLARQAGGHNVSSMSLGRLGFVAATLASEARTLGLAVDRFESVAEERSNWLAEMDLAILPDDALRTTLREGYEMFHRTGRLLLTASLSSLKALGLLSAALGRAGVNDPNRCALDLTAGCTDLATVRPVVAFSHVVAIVERDPEARAVLIAGARGLGELPRGPSRRALEAFVGAFGARGLGETDVGRPRFREAPEQVFALLRGALAMGARDPDSALREVRVASDHRLAELERTLGFLELRYVRAVIDRIRALLGLRERLRVGLAHATTMLRTIASDADARLGRLDPTLAPGAAYFVTFEELLSALGNYRADLGPLVRMRVAEYQTHRALAEPPSRFRGMPSDLDMAPLLDAPVLRGSGFGTSRVEGTVVRLEPSLDRLTRLAKDSVLVVPQADLGMALLYPGAAAVVVEGGSILSHAVLVGRELGCPIVTGVDGAHRVLRDGERVVVDARRGVVERDRVGGAPT